MRQSPPRRGLGRSLPGRRRRWEMSIDWSWLLVFAGAVLVLVEVLLGGFAGFDLVLIGSAFILGGVAGLLTKSPALAYSSAAVLGVAYIAVGRRLVRERL